MAAHKNSFGVDPAELKKLNLKRAIARILHDARSDFIYAPHLNFIYSYASEDLTSRLEKELKSGTYSPGLPITIEVPKTARMSVAKRPGPSFSRPGSILLPKDRLLYQSLADAAAPDIAKKTDKDRSFSHQLSSPDDDAMFRPTRVCWNHFQQSLKKNSDDKKIKYAMKIDIANCFGSINQHTLINALQDAGYSGSLSAPLEILLGHFTGNRSSRGIVQGVFPSDLFGNFYLAPIDRFLKDRKIPSSRYVDDVFIFLENAEAADKLLRDLVPMLRSYDLSLNEAKSLVMPKGAIQNEEPDLEELFNAAIEEIAEQTDEEDLDVDYGFQTEFSGEEDFEEDEIDLDLEATKNLFESIDQYQGQEEKIERFCLPLFLKSGSDYAVDYVMENFNKRPSMTQIYVNYLSRFTFDRAYDVTEFLVDVLDDDSLADWQRMWVVAGLLRSPKHTDDTVKISWDIYNDANRHPTLRAAAAILVGRYGDHARRTDLINSYNLAGSPYIQAAIYYSSRWFKAGVERSNAKASWGSLNELNELISIAIQNAPKIP